MYVKTVDCYFDLTCVTLLDFFPHRQSYMASPDSLDTALCEAVQRGWWWGASQLVAAGARAHAAYNTTVYRGIQRKEVTLTRCVYCITCQISDVEWPDGSYLCVWVFKQVLLVQSLIRISFGIHTVGGYFQLSGTLWCYSREHTNMLPTAPNHNSLIQ